VDQGEEETWDTVAAAPKRSTNPLLSIEEVVPAPAQQAAGADNSQTSATKRRTGLSLATVPEQPEEAQAEDEATAEAGIIDKASILGAPTVTVVRSTL
jgi:hypothetical protein